MSKLSELARVLRSKNSGPFAITLDILFDSERTYRRVKDSGRLNPGVICRLYGLRAEEITDFVWFDAALGLKITYLRRVASGSAGDRDVYGSQQHAPLMNLVIP